MKINNIGQLNISPEGQYNIKFLEKGVALSPPWYLVWAKIKSTIGEDKSIRVKEMYSEAGKEEIVWKIDINVDSYEKARGLALILKNKFKYGKNIVRVSVYCGDEIVKCPQVPEDIPMVYAAKTLIEKALRDNPLFESVLIPCMFQDNESAYKVNIFGGTSTSIKSDIALVFAREVIQYYADDLNDLFLNQNMVAKDIFAEVLKDKAFDILKITFTTQPNIITKYIND